MRRTMTRVMVVLLLLASVAPPAEAQVDQQRAQEFFKEAQALCERDRGRLWGVSLCAPTVIGDARTQTFATSQPPPGCASTERHRSTERAHSVGRHAVGGNDLGNNRQLAGWDARRGVPPRVIPHGADVERHRDTRPESPRAEQPERE